jgi:hypothetical protein
MIPVVDRRSDPGCGGRNGGGDRMMTYYHLLKIERRSQDIEIEAVLTYHSGSHGVEGNLGIW